MLHAFLPSAAWALRLASFPVAHTTNWHILFHNMHYLPLMATVIVRYVLMTALTGVKSVFGGAIMAVALLTFGAGFAVPLLRCGARPQVPPMPVVDWSGAVVVGAARSA